MSKQMLNEKTFSDVDQYQPVTIPGRPDVAERTGVMTLNGTIGRAAFLLILAVAAGAYGWSYGDQMNSTVVTVLLLGLIGLFALSILTAFKPRLAPFTGPVYALVMGFWAGLISFGYNAEFPGIVLQAMFATFSIFGVCLFLYATRIVKVTQRFLRAVIFSTLAIGVMYLVAIVMSLFGVDVTFLNSPSIWGIGISVVICIVASLNLFVDFHFIEQGTAAGAPTYLSWYCAFALMATLIWIYLEILRLLSKLRS